MAHKPMSTKVTHFGLIPDDWNVFEAKVVCTKVTDGTHDTPKPVDIGVPYITAIHVKSGKIDFNNCLYLSKEDHELIYKRCNPEKGDLLVVNIGAGVAECGLVEVDYEFSIKNVALLKPNRLKLDGKFLLQQYLYRKERIAHVVKTGGAQPFLSLSELGRLKIITPPLLEQTKIAQILSTWDKAIETTEKLIENSKAQKKALMQQLLTGKRRFPGEWGTWKNKQVRDLVEIHYGKSPKEINPNVGIYPVIGTGGVTNHSNIAMHQGPSVVIGRKGTIDKPQLIHTPFWAIDTTFYCVPKEECDIEWFYYIVKSLPIKKYNEASGVPSLSRETLYGIRISAPTPNEQKRIAQILKTSSSETTLLKKQLFSLSMQKKALMQQLLTGKRRVELDNTKATKSVA